MAGEEETETFAFQAEINQLLSLIINVRFFKIALVLFMRCTSSRARAQCILSFPAQIFSSGDTSVFSRLFVCAMMTLTRFSPSLTLAYADVLLEQRDLFARIDQVRLYMRARMCVLLSKTVNEREKRTFR